MALLAMAEAATEYAPPDRLLPPHLASTACAISSHMGSALQVKAVRDDRGG
jgi:hypothetical protein